MNKLILAISLFILASCGSEDSKSAEMNNSGQFEWNFSKKRTFVYAYSQRITSENKMGKESVADKSFMTGNGQLNVRVKDNKFADLSITDLEMKMVMVNEDGIPKDTMTQKLPATVVQDMKPDGSFGNANTDILFDLLLPLPSKSLAEGDSEKIPLQMPFNANGSRLFSKGQNTLTFTGYKEIEGRNCAVLKGEIDISKLEIPEELEGEYECATTGKATYYFDLENGIYVGADIDMKSDVLMDTEAEKNNEFGMYMDMKSNSIYKIRLQSIEE